MGRQEFEEWSDRIMSAALIPGVTVESQKFCLAGALLQLDPGEDHATDAKFVKMLRKACVAQTGQTMIMEIKEAQKKRWEEEAKKAEENKIAEATAPTGAESHEQILAS